MQAQKTPPALASKPCTNCGDHVALDRGLCAECFTNDRLADIGFHVCVGAGGTKTYRRPESDGRETSLVRIDYELPVLLTDAILVGEIQDDPTEYQRFETLAAFIDAQAAL